ASSPSLSVAATVSDSGTLSYQWYSSTTSSNSGGAAISGATSASYAAPTLAAGTTYYYVVVTNTNSSATGSQTATATSNAAKLTVNAAVSSAPTGLTAIAGNGQVALTWNGISETVTYSVYKGTASGFYGLTPIATVSGTTYSYTVTGLTNGATYYFAVTTSNAGGSSNYSNEVSATPKAPTPGESSTTSETGFSGGETNTATIAAASGGTTRLNGATIEVPAGAMASNIQVTVDKVSDTSILPLDSALQLVSEVYEIKKDKDGEFSKPIVITLPFDKTKVDFGKSTIGIYWLNEQTHKWVSLDSLKVDEENGTVSGTVSHFTKFAVLASDKAKPVQPQTNEAEFADIKGHWSEENVRELVKLGAIKGYPDNTFKPNANITRAEFVTVIVNAFHLEEQDGKIFADTETHWAKSAITTAAAKGIIAGYSDNSFGPDELINREQMAAIIVRAAKLAATDLSVNSPDSVDISDWARKALATATAKGLINGYEDGTLKPKVNTTRAEAVAVILRALHAQP
ncbi:S-layer homology domain-containing protein, partial [Paenibacillus alba]